VPPEQHEQPPSYHSSARAHAKLRPPSLQEIMDKFEFFPIKCRVQRAKDSPGPVDKQQSKAGASGARPPFDTKARELEWHSLTRAGALARRGVTVTVSGSTGPRSAGAGLGSNRGPPFVPAVGVPSISA
jgi:hypothetical protein